MTLQPSVKKPFFVVVVGRIVVIWVVLKVLQQTTELMLDDPQNSQKKNIYATENLTQGIIAQVSVTIKAQVSSLSCKFFRAAFSIWG